MHVALRTTATGADDAPPTWDPPASVERDARVGTELHLPHPDGFEAGR